jgi:hypothetical protein
MFWLPAAAWLVYVCINIYVCMCMCFVCSIFGQKLAPDGVNVWNPAFDVTPCSLIRGIITELVYISGVLACLPSCGVLCVVCVCVCVCVCIH